MNKRVGYGLRPTVYDIRYTGYGLRMECKKGEKRGEWEERHQLRKRKHERIRDGNEREKKICIKYK